MKLSARNQFPGKVVKVEKGAVNGIVTLDVNGGKVTGTITLNAIRDLGLEEGVEAAAVIKATEVMIGFGPFRMSARNQFPGRITEVEEGAVNGVVRMDVLGGNKLSAVITMTSIRELGLKPGVEATAVIKATSVMFAR